MFDLKLTESGDIDVSTERPISSYKVSFSLVDIARQRISFIIAPPSVGLNKKAPLKISFKYIKSFDDYKVQDKPVDDLHEAIQAIRIMLRTEKNNVRNLDIGSHTYQMQHSLYRKENDLEDIQGYIQEIVNTILPEATVTAKYADDEAAGYFRHQAVKVHIDYEGKTLDEFVF